MDGSAHIRNCWRVALTRVGRVLSRVEAATWAGRRAAELSLNVYFLFSGYQWCMAYLNGGPGS